MKRKDGVPLARAPRGPAGSDEQPWVWHTASLEELELRYGSPEVAGERYRALRRLGGSGFFEMPMKRAEIWWVTESGVPDDLRRSPRPHPHVWIGSLPQTVQKAIRELAERREEWLISSGHATSEEIRRRERYEHL